MLVPILIPILARVLVLVVVSQCSGEYELHGSNVLFIQLANCRARRNGGNSGNGGNGGNSENALRKHLPHIA